jgi:tetratricopeptide (TPR) repeat protein
MFFPIKDGVFVKKKEHLYLQAYLQRADTLYTVGECNDSSNDYLVALHRSRDSTQKIASSIGLSRVLCTLGDYDRSIQYADKAISIAQQEKNIEKECQCIAAKAFALQFKGDYNNALKLSNTSLRVLRTLLKDVRHNKEKLEDIELRISNTINTIGIVHNDMGDHLKALTHFQEALKIAQKWSHKPTIIKLFNNIGLMFWQQKKMKKALEGYRNGLFIANEIGYKDAIALISLNIGLIHFSKRALDRALDFFNRSLAMNKETGNKRGAALALNNMGLVFEMKGKYEITLEHYLASLGLFKDIGHAYGISLLSCNIGTVYQERGDITAALKYQKKAEILACRSNIADVMIRSSLLKGDILKQQGEYKKSKDILKKAVAHAEKCNLQDLAAMVTGSYISNLIELEKRKPGAHRKELASHVKRIQNICNNTGTKMDDPSLLHVLLRYYIFTREFEKAKAILNRLYQAIKETGSERFLPAALYHDAFMRFHRGKSYKRALDQARVLAQESGLLSLLKEIDALKKRKGSQNLSGIG